jgi:triosephosphate isomerase (TIM)
MRYLIANWKMQLDGAESEVLAREVVRLLAASDANVTVVLCPSHLAIERVSVVLKGTPIRLGAQDSFWEDKGAYTGEVSPKALRDLGCEFGIVGHSERREHLGETDAMINRKLRTLLANGLTPIVCVGETLAERQAGKRDAVVIAQVRTALEGVALVGTQRVIVAYEPRWVIGTGQAVAPDDAASMHHLIASTLHEVLGEETAKRQTAIVYGGSADSRNIAGFLALPSIDGALVGGASLKPAEFAAMARAAADAS